jgi:hypothetical protein
MSFATTGSCKSGLLKHVEGLLPLWCRPDNDREEAEIGNAVHLLDLPSLWGALGVLHAEDCHGLL